MRVVVKFGGTSVRTPARVRLAARNIAAIRAAGNEVLVVVSAMGDATNRLMRMGRRAWPEAPVDQNLLRLLATGETATASLLAMALGAEGCPAQAVGFDHPDFPLVAMPGQSDAQVLSAGKVNDLVEVRLDERASRSRFAKGIDPMLTSGTIPVFPGFFVRDGEGHLVTLGRGGSDVSAFLVGRFCRADEVVIVTDVRGVLTADPRVVPDSAVVPEMDAALMSAVAQRGAQVLHPNALRYKPESVTARVVHFTALGKLSEGTRITGAATTILSVHPRPLTLHLLFAKGISARLGLLARLGEFTSRRGVAIHGLTSADTVIGLYVEESAGHSLTQALHNEFVGAGRDFEELVVTRNVAEVRLTNPAFVNTQGVIHVVSEAMHRAGLLIVEMVTSHADVVVYCQFDQAQKVHRVLAERLGIGNGSPASGGRSRKKRG
jgi:aspartate kinase